MKTKGNTMTTKVYVLFQEFSYEGSALLGIYDSLAKAKAAKKRAIKSEGEETEYHWYSIYDMALNAKASWLGLEQKAIA